MHEGFAPPATSWDLSPYLCCGAVLGPGDASAALLVAVRGAALALGPVDERAVPGFVDELCRFATSTGRRVVESDPTGPPPDPVVQDLLDALARGLTMPEAARACAVSLRTAHRRLAEARARSDLPTTGALLVRTPRLDHGRGPAA